MEPMQAIYIIVFVLLLVIYLLREKKRKPVALPDNYDDMMEKHVAFYRNLSAEDQARFVDKVKDFLSYVRIHGVNTEITELDKMLVAASAVIPIFGFDEWKYHTVKDVLLYPGSFNNENFSTENGDLRTLGMVGDGAMQQVVVFSLPSLREGFRRERDKENTGIHEFVHLLDKEDGAVDGIPEILLTKQYSIPWLKFMSQEIGKMKNNRSDINIYGATNKAEFFAVASEYFFQQPHLFKEKHPELFELLEKIFHQDLDEDGDVGIKN
ncbi:M90 family metallopeptidase [Pinibacter aurantiacus]|nr:M90 family metallopeptidase [Pinibacter aurantiacus]